VEQLQAPEDARVVEALRARDEVAFTMLVQDWSPAMLRVARIYVPTRAIAEEVVQDTWIAVLRGIDRFEGRSSLRTWVFRILTNTAKTRGERERRTIPLSALEDPLRVPEPAVSPDRFLDPDHPHYPGHWASPPASWSEQPEEKLLGAETRGVIDAAIAHLPPAQRAVITLRDVQGWDSNDVCNVLGVSETNQRVLLHRARAKVRQALEEYLDAGTDQ
jgi:RNA polymerase sigma-70 factor (ECF subfamily)